jgi:hypothetical protein
VPLEHVKSKNKLRPITLLQHCDAAGGEVAGNLRAEKKQHQKGAW